MEEVSKENTENIVNKFLPKSRKGKPNKYPINIKRPKMYLFYKNTYKYSKFLSKYSTPEDLIVDAKTYSKVINAMFRIIAKRIIYKSDQFKMPLRLGTIGIKKKKMNFNFLLNTNKLKVDYRTSALHNTLVFHTNEHSDGYRLKWYWDRKRCNIPCLSFYKFVPGFHEKRAAAKAFINKTADYPVQDIKYKSEMWKIRLRQKVLKRQQEENDKS